MTLKHIAAQSNAKELSRNAVTNKYCLATLTLKHTAAQLNAKELSQNAVTNKLCRATLTLKHIAAKLNAKGLSPVDTNAKKYVVEDAHYGAKLPVTNRFHVGMRRFFHVSSAQDVLSGATASAIKFWPVVILAQRNAKTDVNVTPPLKFS